MPAAPDAAATRADPPPPSPPDAARPAVVATPPDAAPRLARPERGIKPATIRKPRPVGKTGAVTSGAAGSAARPVPQGPGAGTGSAPGKGSASRGGGSDSIYGHR